MKKILLFLVVCSVYNSFGQIRLVSETMINPTDNTLYSNIEYSFSLKTPSNLRVTDIRSNKGVLNRKDDITFTFITTSKDDDDIIFTYDIIENEQTTKNIDYPIRYKVIDFPDSVMQLRFGTKTGGNLSLNELKQVTELKLNDQSCLINLNYQFIKIRISAAMSDVNDIHELNLTTGLLTENKAFQELIKILKVGDLLFFDDVEIQSPILGTRTLPFGKFKITSLE